LHEFYTVVFRLTPQTWSKTMSKMFQVYGIGQALIPVLPPPLPFENPPTSNQTNYEIGQLVFSPPRAPTAFYLYGGGGNWIQFAGSSGDIIAINGTANQVSVSTVAGVATLSLPSAITTPGSLTTTTSLAADTTVTAGTGVIATTGGVTAAAGDVTATAGNLVATVGNLNLNGAASKINIDAATPSSASLGVSGAMSGSPGAVTVTSSAVTTSSVILFSRKTIGGTAGQVSISAQSAGSFTLTSTGNETSTFNYLIIN
jgi:hypothetical protein